ncbi:hypothetical protein [Staphylothermus marinus]|nr:hypothetical protein [Staphylothermus marinus]
MKKNSWVFIETIGVTLIISFIILLVIAAVLLALNNEEYANKFAEIAYYMLVGGVIMQLILLYRERGDRNEGRMQSTGK